MNNKNPKSYRDRYAICDGQVLLYRRTSQGTKHQSDSWYAKFKIPRQDPLSLSLKTTNQKEAEKFAEDLLYDYKNKARRGISLKSKKFSVVAKDFVKHFATQVDKQSDLPRYQQKYKADMLRNIVSITEKYLIPYFEKKTLQNITDDFIESYVDWRNEYWISGAGAKLETVTYIRDGKKITRPKKAAERREPDYSTINKELTVIRKIYKFAIKKKFIEKHEIPEIINLEKPSDHKRKNPGLTAEEFENLVKTMIKRHKAEKNPKHAKHLAITMFYVMMMAHTGIRESEGKALKMSDCETFEKDGKKYLKIFVRAKAKSRELIALDPASLILKRIHEYHLNNAMLNKWQYHDDLPMFTNQYGKHIKSFAKGLNRVFEDANLLYDKNGAKRSAGAFRKYYINAALLDGIPPFTIAKQCGTSITTIEKHYDEMEVKHQPEKLMFNHIFSRTMSS